MSGSRRRFGLHSVRSRLLVWNVGIVALVLAGMGTLTSYTVRAKLMASVERDLREHVGRVQPPPPPRDGPDDDPEFPGPRQSQPPMPREPNGSLSLRIPRVFNPDGKGRPPFQDKTAWDADAFAQSLEGREVMKTIIVDDEPARLLSIPQWPHRPPQPGSRPPPRVDMQEPHLPTDRPVGVIQTIYPLAEINLSVAGVNAALLALIPVALILAGAGGAWLTDRALRPVRQIAQTAARIGADDLRQRLPLTGGDEFEELSGTINGMLERLQGAFGRMEALVEQQRRFTADASHELKTPLTVIKANSSLTLATQPDRAGYHEAVEEIDRAASSMNRLVQDLLILAGADESQSGHNRELVEIGELISRVAAQLRLPDIAEIFCEKIDESVRVLANRDELNRAYTNLVENAQKYTPPEGKITLSCRTDGDRVCLLVEDTGIGIAAEHLPHLCERFYRIDTSRARCAGGSGLGLAICKSLVEANGGTLTISSHLGRGTTAAISLAIHVLPDPSPSELASILGRGLGGA